MEAQNSETGEDFSSPLMKFRNSRGRPAKSAIRQNIVELLFLMKKGYGYDIYKNYRQIFPEVTMRSIYYHLRKGVNLGEFKVEEIQLEKGDYSWGAEAEKTYYSLGPKASPIGDNKVVDYFNEKNK